MDPISSRKPDSETRFFRIFPWIMGAGALVGIGLLSGAVWIAVHFISKYW